MAGLTGDRGSNRRRLLVAGIFALGFASVLLIGYLMEKPVQQVYWAIYSRLHPMRDGTEEYEFSKRSSMAGTAAEAAASRGTSERRLLPGQMGSFPQTTTRGEGVVTDGVDKGSAAAAAIAAGEKNMVALLPAGEERIQHRAHEKSAAKKGVQREAEMQEAKETKNVQDVAEQLQAKATAAYSAEIAAVASPEEADRLQSKLQSEAVDAVGERIHLNAGGSLGSGATTSRKSLWSL